MRKRVALLLAAAALSATVTQAEPQRETPYMASIASGRAMMRTGPGQTYPGTWLYVRRDLPIRVIRIYHDWRQIEDPGGTRGWMLVSLLSDQRTAIVTGEGLAELRESPDAASAVRFRAEVNVVGRISRCASNWCYFDVHGRGGYISTDRLWGVAPNETVR
ncbi:SH3 domain-containing protein [Allosphingosinicella sp.]|uniref:SH3 domain-containing protein n=1 Tax=Allosphingosinicella sp. TaxID=2823234 RepID=UPI003784A47A